ncbi:hypothetical protein ACFXP3_32385 [Streptomyces sp. NPDC059096]|uniref:hypothetical protein n=1 Tax=Streptomyces sp. NPDC059096 TaxID=3346727 RepID=UPI0036C69B87
MGVLRGRQDMVAQLVPVAGAAGQIERSVVLGVLLLAGLDAPDRPGPQELMALDLPYTLHQFAVGMARAAVAAAVREDGFEERFLGRLLAGTRRPGTERGLLVRSFPGRSFPGRLIRGRFVSVRFSSGRCVGHGRFPSPTRAAPALSAA